MSSLTAAPHRRYADSLGALLSSQRALWQTRSWWLAIAAACAASTVAALAAGSPVTPAILLGLIGSVVVAALPFRWIVIAMVIAGGFTRIDVAVAGFDLRPDIVLVPAALIACCRSGRFGDLVRWMRHPVIVLLALFVALQYPVSALAAPAPAKSLSVATWLLLNLAVVVLTLTCFGDDRRALYRCLALTAFIVVASGVLGWLVASIFGAGAGVVSDSSGMRALGIAFEPNILAGTAAMWAVILLTSSRRLRGLDYVFLAFCLVAIPLSDTRAAAIALAAGVAVYVVLRPRRASRLALVGLIATGAFVAVQATAPVQSASLSQKLLDYGDPTASARVSSIGVAVSDLSGTSWLVGLGTNSYGQRHLEPTLLPAEVPAYLGNLPLQALYDSGLFGLGLLAAAASVLIWRGDKSRRAALMLTFLAISSATSPFFFANWWLLIALALSKDAKRAAQPGMNAAPLPGSAQRPATERTLTPAYSGRDAF